MDIFKKGIKSSSFHILGAGVGFLFQFLAARVLGISEFGKANYIFGLASSISIIFSFGITFYFPKVFQHNIDKEKLFSGIVYSTGLFFILFYTLFFVFYKSVLFSTYDFIILFFLILFLYLVGYYRSYLIGNYSAEKATKIGNFYLRILSLGFFLFLILLFGKKYYTYLVALIIGNFIILLPFLLKTLRTTKPNFSFLKHASIFYFIQLFYVVFGEFSKVLQGNFTGIDTVAILSISIVIGQIITLFGVNFANVVLPVFASAYKDRNYVLIREKFQETSRINIFIVLPIFFLFISNTDTILGFLGKEYEKGNIILFLILIGSFINSIVGPNGSLLLMGGKQKWELFNGIGKFIVALSLSLLLGKKFIWGIAFGLAASDIFVNLLKGIEVYYLFKVLPFNKKEGVFILILTGLEGFFFIILKIFGLSSISVLIFGSLLIITFWVISFSRSPNNGDRRIFTDVILLSVNFIKHSILGK